MKKPKQMRNRNLGIILLMAVLCLTLASQATAAEKKWIFHEDKWAGILAYGSVPIDKDSPGEWGPWTQFVQPAAGLVPVAALPAMHADGTTYFRPESADEYSRKYDLKGPEILEELEDFCKGGEWCGYAIYKNYNKDNSERFSSQSIGKNLSGWLPGRIALTLTPGETEDDCTYCKLEGTASWRAIGLFGEEDPNFTESGDMAAKFFGKTANFFAHTEDSETDNAYANGHNPWGYPDEFTKGFFGRNAETDPYVKSGVNGIFIAGIPTSLTDMSALRANNFKATYCGWTFLAGSHVIMDVDFGQSILSAIVNKGSDGWHVWKGPDGTLNGKVGFTFTANITGADFHSTSISANDLGPGGKITGNVLGTFYGKNAVAAAGVIDITKTKVVEYNGEVSVSGYSKGYTDGKYVDLFKALQVQGKPIED